MNKTTKYILYGIGSFAGVMLIITIVRCLLGGVAFGEELKDWTNWVVAAGAGISSAWTAVNNDKKKAAENKEEEEKEN